MRKWRYRPAVTATVRGLPGHGLLLVRSGHGTSVPWPFGIVVLLFRCLQDSGLLSVPRAIVWCAMAFGHVSGHAARPSAVFRHAVPVAISARAVASLLGVALCGEQFVDRLGKERLQVFVWNG